MMKNIIKLMVATLLLLALVVAGCGGNKKQASLPQQDGEKAVEQSITMVDQSKEDFRYKSFFVTNQNRPLFTQEDLSSKKSFEHYSKLDSLGRCGVAYANLSKSTMPKKGEERGSIGSVKPSGWKMAKYDFIDGKYLYNRSHLIGYQLSAENANAKNLITGTRYMNVQGMLPFENKVADYINRTGHHVLYRVTPLYDGKDLVPYAVQMEALSVEDQGKGVAFNVTIPNIQPGVEIDYATGDSKLLYKSKDGKEDYVVVVRYKEFHRNKCSKLDKYDTKIMDHVHTTRKALLKEKYKPCKVCKP